MSECRLEDVSLFKSLSADETRAVREAFTTETLAAGKNLITEGETGDDMFILVSGRVRVSKSMVMAGLNAPILETDDPRKVLATLDAGDFPFFGEMALLDRERRSATVTAVEESCFLRITRDAFFDLIKSNPELGSKLLMALCRRLASVVRRNNAEIIKLTTALALLISRKKTA